MPSGTLTYSAIGLIGGGVIDMGGDTFKVALSNVAPTTADVQLSDITQIANGNGYTTGGSTVASTGWADSGSGVWAFTGNDVMFTASGGTMATFRYIVLYSDTSTDNKLVLFYDYGSGVSLLNTETFLVDFTTGVTILTLG